MKNNNFFFSFTWPWSWTWTRPGFGMDDRRYNKCAHIKENYVFDIAFGWTELFFIQIYGINGRIDCFFCVHCTILVTHHFWKRLIQLNFRNSVCPMVVSGFHCRWGPIFADDAGEKNSAMKKKKWKKSVKIRMCDCAFMTCVFCLQINYWQIQTEKYALATVCC